MTRRRPVPTAVIGTGRLARTLLPLLGPAGYPVIAVAGRSSEAARTALRGIRGARIAATPSAALCGAQLVLLAVPDGALGPLAERLAAQDERWSGRIALHHAGALGPEPLAALAARGAGVGVLHPLQVLAGGAASRRALRGSRARIEGDARGRPAAARLARALGLLPLDLRGRPDPTRRRRYHAAAALASNDLVALLATAAETLERSGVEADAALEALLPLARGTLDALERDGFGGALTGPVVRGDATTLTRHVRVLPAEAARIHRLLSLRLVRLARRHGSLSGPDAARVRRVLATGTTGDSEV